MKKMQLILFLLIGLTSASIAQQKAVVTVVIKTPTVQCDQCKQRIENYMSHEINSLKKYLFCQIDRKELYSRS